MENFIVVGENIHCTRIVKRNGKRCKELPGGGEGVYFDIGGEEKILPVPGDWEKISPPFESGKCRHVALAIHQALNGTGEAKELGLAYICWAAERQIGAGAKFLDVNVDEYTNDDQERVEVMTWLVKFLSEKYDTPLSIDSSNAECLNAGLANCRKDTAPMVNSVSLERPDLADVIIEHKADAIVSAAGREDLPSGIDDRLKNFGEIVGILTSKGMELTKMHLDALVLPISVNAENGKNFIDASTKAKAEFAGVNLNGGLSNISFGMPNRKLLNMVFCRLFAEKGGNGGIIDPVQMPVDEIAKMDMDSEPFKLAQGVLEGTDDFGMEYITASRDGRI